MASSYSCRGIFNCGVPIFLTNTHHKNSRFIRWNRHFLNKAIFNRFNADFATYWGWFQLFSWMCSRMLTPMWNPHGWRFARSTWRGECAWASGLPRCATEPPTHKNSRGVARSSTGRGSCGWCPCRERHAQWWYQVCGNLHVQPTAAPSRARCRATYRSAS